MKLSDYIVICDDGLLVDYTGYYGVILYYNCATNNNIIRKFHIYSFILNVILEYEKELKILLPYSDYVTQNHKAF